MVNRYGTDNNDTLVGTSRSDRLEGRGGADVLFGRGGRDILLGGAGDDYLHLGIDGQYSDISGSQLDGGDGFDWAYISLFGVTQNIRIGSDLSRITANDGDGSVTRTLVTMDGIERLTAYLGSGDDYVHVQSNAASIWAADGRDRLVGGDLIDLFHGEGDDDVLFGNDGNDTLNGGAGDDRIYGGAGIDAVDGGEGQDYLYGGDGNDSISGGLGQDRIHGDAGDDILSGWVDDDVIFGDAGNDVITGEWGADRLYGGVGDDRLDGGDDRDLLDGGDGNDIVRGGNGDDRIYGGLGADQLYGGAGRDRFVWRSLAEGGDTVQDFDRGQDRLVIAGDAVGGIARVDATNFVSNANGVAEDAGDRFLYARGTHQLFFDADGTGSAAPSLIATIVFNSGTQITASDILIG